MWVGSCVDRRPGRTPVGRAEVGIKYRSGGTGLVPPLKYDLSLRLSQITLQQLSEQLCQQLQRRGQLQQQQLHCLRLQQQLHQRGCKL